MVSYQILITCFRSNPLLFVVGNNPPLGIKIVFVEESFFPSRASKTFNKSVLDPMLKRINISFQDVPFIHQARSLMKRQVINRLLLSCFLWFSNQLA